MDRQAVMRPVVISDRLTAAGFRLAGLDTTLATPETVGEKLNAALRGRQPVLLTADLAAHLPADQLTAIIRRAQPPLAVVPDVSGHGSIPDLAGSVRRALGVET
ncbi:MAG: V-type ATP synthase subunit F [Wenzhouxiangella sp.]|jgi:vacuolar-type H+-ATPase subunit F/Vma7|nr:V-type ATP synthase subunit F [Wenzhouxiangella sp.]